MAPPSKVRKEEAELRQIAKQSRLARKEAAQRERKQQQREQRKAAQLAASGEAAPAAKEKDASAPRKRQAAIILPSEVAELRSRMDTPAAATQESSPAKKKGGKKSKAAANTTTAAAASSSAASSSYAEPGYHFEIHYKKKMVMVDVVLHHVPHQKIDISETNETQLVVDTTKHTKKFRLVLPMPSGLRIKHEDATYDLESGVLQCRLPIKGEEIPAELQQQWDGMMEKIREQRALRFRVSKDGDLTVRTREALLAKDTKSQEELHEIQVAEKRNVGKRDRAAAVESEEDEDEEEEKKEKVVPKAKKARSENAAPKKAAKADVFMEEHARAMEMAKASAAQVKQSIREKVQLAKEVQQKRQERVQARSERKEVKEDRKQQSFERVIEEQRRQLLARASLNAATADAERKREAAKKSGVPSKSVSFA